MNKPFDKKLYSDYDSPAKAAAAQFLRQKGFTPLVPLNEQFRSHDLEAEGQDYSNFKVEVEVKAVWTKTGCWQGYSTIDIPFRKTKSESDIFLMFNKNLDTMAATTFHKIRRSPVTRKDTIYTENEEFFNVDLDQFKFYHKIDGTWTQIDI